MRGSAKGGPAPMEVDGAASLEDRFALLDGHIKKNELKRAVKVADEILSVAPQDGDAYKCKVVALVQSGQVAAALDAINSNPIAGLDFSFEKGYCLYRLNKLGEALTALKTAEPSAGVLQLEAQALYRLGQSADCIRKYEELLSKYKVDSVEVKTNIVAAYVTAGRSKEVPGLMIKLKVAPRDAFDLGYNAASALIETGQLEDATELLMLSQRVGKEMLIDEEYTEEEIEDELAPIAVQLAYVLQAQGQTQEAMEAYNAVLKKKPSDAPSVAVASNNLIVLRGKRDLFDALKRFDRMLEKKGGEKRVVFVSELEPKLSLRQKEAIAFNRFLLLLHSRKLDSAREMVASLSATFPESEMPPLLHASLLLEEKKAAKAEELLSSYAEKKGGDSLAAQLVRTQAAASAGQLDKAAEVLQSIPSLQHKPGTVATLVAMKERAGNVAGAEAVLDKAVAWWDNHMDDRPRASSCREVLLREAAAFKLKQGKHRAAAELYKRLLDSSSAAVRADAVTGLVASAAQFDPSVAERYEADLPPLPGVLGLDAAALERAASSATPSISGRKARLSETGDLAGQKRGTEAGAEKKAKKRKKTIRLPKGFDPANPSPPPDPERWLPRRERSTFKKSRGKKKEVNMRGAQGAAAKEVAAPAVAAPEPASEVKATGGGGSNKNKKKKGKR